MGNVDYDDCKHFQPHYGMPGCGGWGGIAKKKIPAVV